MSNASSTTSPTPRLWAEALTLGYDGKIISENLSVAIPDGEFTVIVGPNACGKSTLLRALSRLLKPQAGQVILDGKNIASLDTRHVARHLGLLPQSSQAPDGISVLDLVARGRYPTRNYCSNGHRLISRRSAMPCRPLVSVNWQTGQWMLYQAGNASGFG